VAVDTDVDAGLYEGLLGEAVEQLAPVVRAVHVGSGPVQGQGSVEVRRTHFLAWVAARWFALPPAGSVLPLQLVVTRTPHHETWTRRFGDRALVTQQFAARHELVERAGRGELRFRLSTEHGTLCFGPLGAAVHVGGFRIPVPRRLSPQVSGTAAASPDGDRLVVCFTVGAPLVGTILTYHVELEPSP
jgi:hypothetical protein